MSEFEATSLLLAKWSLAISALSLVGILLAFIVLRRDVKRDRRNIALAIREKGREAWLDYLNLCLHNTELDVFDVPIGKVVGEGEGVGRKEQIVIARWFGMVAQGFASSKEANRILHGSSVYIDSEEWHSWIRRFTTRDNFQSVWPEVKGGYDKEFVTWMDEEFFSHDGPRNAAPTAVTPVASR